MPTPSFSNHTTTTEIYTLSLHDALPISVVENGFRTGQCAEGAEQRVLQQAPHQRRMGPPVRIAYHRDQKGADGSGRSEEHTSELQSPYDLVCRLLLEKKKKRVPLFLPTL